MRFAIPFLLLATAAFATNPAVHVNIDGRDVVVWKPVEPAPASGYPVILFSHGYSGCASQSVFLTEGLARAGYLVLAPNHKDAACAAGSLGKLLTNRPEEPFSKEAEWSPETYRDRADDLEAILHAISHGEVIPGAIADMTRIGVAGHSLGGYTALGLAGAWPSWKDPRIKAVLALSPYSSPYLAKGALDQMDVPVMFQGGTADLAVTPNVRRANGAYALSSAPKYYVEFQGAGHLAWTSLNPLHRDLIDRYSVAFFRPLREGRSGFRSACSADLEAVAQAGERSASESEVERHS